MSNKPVTDLPEWNALSDHKAALSDAHISSFFEEDAGRFEHFSLSLPGLLFDYSKHRVTSETLSKLTALAKARGVEEQRTRMLNGEPINASENRAALHMALRGSCADTLSVDGENVHNFVTETLARVESLSEQIRANPDITDIVYIGIGGSNIGPRMAYKALHPFTNGPAVHFVSNIDASRLHNLFKRLSPENTLFIIGSKSFSTQETLTNAELIKDWIVNAPGEAALNERMIAITTNAQAAQNFGIAPENILPMREWIGGRYSLWSAIGLPLAIACGFPVFKALLDGAKAMDAHFTSAPLEKNIPVVMALLGIWYRNFWAYPAHAILPYSHDLRDLPVFMQQMDMESNGKGVCIDGAPLPHKTGPVVFGESGTDCQHAFMQLLHQSAEIIPADFILFEKPQHPYIDAHKKLLAHALAQSEALMEGRENTAEPHRNFPGNRPSSTLILDTLDAHHLGMLLALYEHKIFVQGIIWNINSFDQWGVELGKTNAQTVLGALESTNNTDGMDTSTTHLIEYLLRHS